MSPANEMKTLEGLSGQLNQAIAKFHTIQWLDLSCNQLVLIGNNLDAVRITSPPYLFFAFLPFFPMNFEVAHAKKKIGRCIRFS